MLSEDSQTLWAVERLLPDDELNSHLYMYICMYPYVHVYGHLYACCFFQLRTTLNILL